MMSKITSVFSKDSDGESGGDLKTIISSYKKSQEAKKKLSQLQEKEQRIAEKKTELHEVLNSTSVEISKLLDNKILLSGYDFYDFVKDNFDKIKSSDFESFEKLFYTHLSKQESKTADTTLTDELGEITSDGHIMICADPDNCPIHSLNRNAMLRFKMKALSNNT